MSKAHEASEMLEAYIKNAKQNISTELLQPLEYWQSQLSLYYTRQTGDELLNTLETLGFDLKAIDKALQARRASIKSEAKSNSARLNGLKGGRPKQR